MKTRPLAELEPEFFRLVDERRSSPVERIEDAQGMELACPACGHDPGRERDAHYLRVFFQGRGVPDGALPGPGRWAVSGSGLADVTLSPSIDCTNGGRGPCKFHGWIENGVVRW